jgi:hypothetical protein
MLIASEMALSVYNFLENMDSEYLTQLSSLLFVNAEIENDDDPDYVVFNRIIQDMIYGPHDSLLRIYNRSFNVHIQHGEVDWKN